MEIKKNGKQIKDGIRCCTMNFDTLQNDELFKKYLVTPQTYNTIVCPSYRRPTWKPDMFTYSGGYSCGDTKNQNNCIDCGTGVDSCKNIKNALQNKCQWNEIKKKYGCYKWWSNPNNPYATEWYSLFEKLKSSSYRWVYDETLLYTNKDNWKNAKLTPSSGSDWYRSGNPSKAYTCYMKEDGYGDEQCLNYIVKNKIQPSIMTNITPDLVLTYTVYEILDIN